MPVIDRFNKFTKRGDGCWEWIGQHCHYGYGVLTLWENGKAKLVKAHRLSYEFFVGPIPDGLHVLHNCDNRRCVRPDHLYAGTPQDNMRDVMVRKRNVGIRNRLHGEDSHLTVLSIEQVQELRGRVWYGQSVALAHREMNLPITVGGARKIIAGKCWKHDQ